MELKHEKLIEKFKSRCLLIVPYGIETKLTVPLLYLGVLLIVPYGIETTVAWYYALGSELLIVPYGIETSREHTENGIENCF